MFNVHDTCILNIYKRVSKSQFIDYQFLFFCNYHALVEPHCKFQFSDYYSDFRNWLYIRMRRRRPMTVDELTFVWVYSKHIFFGLYHSLIIPYKPWILLFCASNSDCSSGRIHMYINVEFWLRWTLIKWWENVISVLLLLLTLSDSSNFRRIQIFSIVHHAPEADALKPY